MNNQKSLLNEESFPVLTMKQQKGTKTSKKLSQSYITQSI